MDKFMSCPRLEALRGLLLRLAPPPPIHAGRRTVDRSISCPTATPTSTNVTVQQTQQQALLTWDSFNIGKTTTLTYDQSAGGSNAGMVSAGPM